MLARTSRSAAAFFIMLAAHQAIAQDAPKPAAPPPIAASKIVAVTVYQPNALVTREVDVPGQQGLVELVVGPLPGSVVQSSLYSEGTDGLRVMTTRFRTRVIQEVAEEEARKIDVQLKTLIKEEQALQQEVTSLQANVQFLTKLENFTAATMTTVTEKGILNAESVTALSKYIMETRTAKGKEAIATTQKIGDNKEQQQFLQRERAKLAAGSDKTVREAVIVVDNDKGNAGKVKFNYLVSAATWRPQYKLRAATAAAAPAIQLEYLAAVAQQTGEDWTGVDLTLSTAQPQLNAAPPTLVSLEVGNLIRGGQQQAGVNVNGAKFNLRSEDNRKQAEVYRQEAQSFANSANPMDAQRRFNDAAALQQSDEIINADEQVMQHKLGRPIFLEGQSVTFHLDRRMSVPWRDDEQLIEVNRISLKPDWYYKAVPVVTPHVYRLANLTNDSKLVILPGEATMYLGTDFVGRSQLPLVAIGEQFTAGFGVDPQLQVTRALVDRAKTIQGGNQVHKLDYRLSVSSYKNEAVKLQLWDRLPHSETDAVTVTLLTTSKEVSTDPAYVREEKPKNLMRWDLTVEPAQRGEKAQALTYQFKMEYAKETAIGNFLSK